MKFQEEFFMKILVIAMGKDLASILADMHMAMLEEELYIIFIHENIAWNEKSFIGDGFGIIKSNKKQFSTWVNEFNNLRGNIFIDKCHFGNNVAFMDLFVFKGKDFHINGKLFIKVYQ